MKPKKSKKADLENKRSLFFQMGMIIALIAMILIFNSSWSNTDATFISEIRETVPDDDIVPLVDVPEQPTTVVVPIITDVINIVDENFDTNDVFKWDADDPNFKIPEIVYIAPKKEPIEEPIDEPIPVALLKHKPKFEGGDANTFNAWIGRKIKYPDDALANNVEGKVILQFVIDVDGSLKNIKILRKIDEALASEAVRVVALSPKWTPGQMNGKPVPTVYEFPVFFKIN